MALTTVHNFLVSKRNGGKGTHNPDFAEMEKMDVGDTLYYNLDDKTKYWYNRARYRMVQYGKKHMRKYDIHKGKAELENGSVANVMRITRVM